MAKGFLSILKPLDAQRLQKSVKATVQNSGRLTFAMDAVKDMKLDETKSIIILAANDNSGNLGAAISTKGDPEAFALKKCGAYFYVSFKNYLQQAGIDYKNQRVIYDITELDEEYKPGMTLYKFERRIIAKGSKDDLESEAELPVEAQATLQNAPEAPAKPSEDEDGATTAPNAETPTEAFSEGADEGASVDANGNGSATANTEDGNPM